MDGAAPGRRFAIADKTRQGAQTATYLATNGQEHAHARRSRQTRAAQHHDAKNKKTTMPHCAAHQTRARRRALA